LNKTEEGVEARDWKAGLIIGPAFLLFKLSTSNPQFKDQLVPVGRCNVAWMRRVFVLTHLVVPYSNPLILLLMQGFPSEFSNPAFCHLISPIDLFFKIGTLLFLRSIC
jgi:hypothetical protein